MMKNYLIKLGDGWLDVRGTVIPPEMLLHWVDDRDGSKGVTDEYIPHYPRRLSKKEKGYKNK
jgi:hypothetical protein